MLLKTFRDEFILLTPGRNGFPRSFEMGSDDGPPSQRPAHTVTFAKDFAIARYEVPQNLWAAVMGDNPSRWKGPRNSVEMLSFDDAQRFCRLVTQRLREEDLIADDQQVRLPSEAEWEYAVRAGTDHRYSFGNDAEPLGQYAWFHGNAAGNDPAVGAKQPNAWGLYDVHGYLWEWCLDTAHDNYQGAPQDGSAWIDADPDRQQQRVIRGGSWKDAAEYCTSRNREGDLRLLQPPDPNQPRLKFRGGIPGRIRDDAIGLRCVLQ